ncbi:FAD-dependent oxidoreductase [Aurantimonas sp. 22II-16-19i]|uniref:NAD(P)/FAD-dependent oxidoreductase n=1 Tax=Aurantimonas sp. 22II-16-19i TaxID=1317114 RepID=UPI0009F7D1FB|nr:FAD-dependent oxidoreductase [Aurantimonas sp. 22II-16-19i]ORE97341.1 D-amino-acid dehydrogenase [Aurantimonas sp. 22II-16-19i]
MTDVIVLGAGMAGVGAALALQAEGRTVVVVDRQPKFAGETSYGNAGIIQSEAVEPYAMPTDVPSLIAIALKRTNDVEWNVESVLGELRSLFGYFRHSQPRRLQAITRTYGTLIRRSREDHAPYIEAAGAGDLIRRDGFHQAYRDAAKLASAVKKAERVNEAFGVGFTALDAAGLMAAEPALKPGFAGAIHWTDSWCCSSPGELTQAYGELFLKRGGRLLDGDAETLAKDGAGWRVETADGPITARDVVVCLGAWSPKLLKRFGYKIPMVRKRGYHQHFRNNPLDKPLMDASVGAVFVPMKAGMRITTGAELTAMTATQNLRQLAEAEAGARKVLDFGGPVENRPWHGTRPCMPDMLPVVGKAPRHDGLWFDFGHGHQGFTLGPTTGMLLAGLMAGRADPVMAALSPQRLS